MISILKSKEKLSLLIFISLICLVSFLALWRSFFFHFWRDDWIEIWAAVYQQHLLFDKIATINWHPILIYEQLFLAKFFQLNPLYWQLFGWVLKIIDSLAIALMIFGLTNSKRAAIYTGLIFAASVGGIESMTFASAHTSALIIPFITTGLYFWVLLQKAKNVRYLILSLVLFSISIWGDPGRGIVIIVIVIIWDLLTFMQNVNKQTVVKFSKKILFILLFLIFMMSFIGSKRTIMLSQIVDNLSYIKSHSVVVVTKILNPYGNLMIGWIIPARELGSLSSFNYFSMLVGLFLWITTLLLAILFIFRKDNYYKMILFFCFWIIFFFLPNWIVGQDLVSGGTIVGTTHRYLTLSTVGLAALIGISLSKIRNNNFRLTLLVLVILLNIIAANKVLREEGQFRKATIVNRLWNQIDKDVVPGEKNLVFVYRGDGYLERSALAWSLSIPFGIKRGYNKIDDFPLVVNDWEIMEKLVCGKPVDRSIVPGFTKSNPVPLSHIYAWIISDGVLTNISGILKKEISERIKCN